MRTVLILLLLGNLATAQDDVHANGANFVEDAKTYRERAEQGDATAQAALARMYYQGKQIAQDYTEAARWYRKAAELGNAKAQYNLGYMYWYGQGLLRIAPRPLSGSAKQQTKGTSTPYVL